MKLRPLDDNETNKLNLKGIEFVPLKNEQRDKGIMIRDTVTGTYLFIECPLYREPIIYADLPKEVEVVTPQPATTDNPDQPVV